LLIIYKQIRRFTIFVNLTEVSCSQPAGRLSPSRGCFYSPQGTVQTIQVESLLSSPGPIRRRTSYNDSLCSHCHERRIDDWIHNLRHTHECCQLLQQPVSDLQNLVMLKPLKADFCSPQETVRTIEADSLPSSPGPVHRRTSCNDNLYFRCRRQRTGDWTHSHLRMYESCPGLRKSRRLKLQPQPGRIQMTR